MKRFVIILGLVAIGLTSCKKFLEEKPEGFISPEVFFKTPNQIQTAVDGCYKGLDRPYVSIFLGLPLSEYWSLELLTGFSTNPFAGDAEQQYRLLAIDPANDYLKEVYQGVYVPMANINNAIANIQSTTVVDAATRDKYLGQLYFLRAWHYFHGVQLMGEIPLVIAPVTSIKPEDIQVPKATRAKIYDQIVADLKLAETAGLPWSDATGHVTTAAAKSLLAKVYITMAGYPLEKGTEYYNLAYEKAKEVIDAAPGNGIKLFTNYEELRGNNNTGEHIFQVQRRLTTQNNELHYGMLPSPGKVTPDLSSFTVFDTALLPTIPFYETYDAGDKRTQDKQFFFAYLKNGDGSAKEVMNYKFWDAEAAVSINYGSDQNIWLIRYADVLLLCAEAKASAQGGTTGDAAAVDAYYQVRKRAFPGAVKPGTITADQVLKERFHELAFEYISWYDMLRTRKTLNTTTKAIVNLIGYTATTHPRAFEIDDLTLPLPLQEVQKNPKLNEPAQ